MQMDYDIAYYTDAGTTKEMNQDSCGGVIADTLYGPACMAVLCDGMGGISKGEYASQTVVQEFIRWFEEIFPRRAEDNTSLDRIGAEWSELLIRMDEQLRAYGAENGIKLGTTATCMLFWKEQYLLVQSGDSRAYEIHRDVKQLSKDQSYVQRLIDEGKITEQEALRHPKRNILTDCIGGSHPSVPVCSFGKVTRRSHYLLCSDGLVHELNRKEMLHFLTPKVTSAVHVLGQRLKQMTQLVKTRGETDNITALTVIVRKKKSKRKLFGRKEKKPEKVCAVRIREKLTVYDSRNTAEEQTITTGADN